MSDVSASEPRKSVGTAYLLWFLFGAVGAHKFYLGRPGVGAIYMVLWVAFWVLLLRSAGLMVAAAPLGLLWIALLYDLFTLPAQARAAGEGVPAGVKPGSMFKVRDEPVDYSNADAAIARYLEKGGGEPASHAMRPARASAGGRPAFGRR